ncbi:MAG TPA: ATP-binding protein [Acidobacteriaceae bacterium]|nr:ATP-binding protein [Acidobacteriaceae bacterium]
MRIEMGVNHSYVSTGLPSMTAAEQVAATELYCEDEPIRVPGAVQQHGFLLMTDGDFKTVLLASENAERYLQLPLRLILGSGLDTLLERELLSSLQLLRLGSSTAPEQEGLTTFLGSFRVAGQFFSVVTHCSGQDRILEFELQDRLVGPEMMNGVITNFVGKLSRLRTEQDLCEALTRQVADLTGFDRVLLYSFDQEDHGTVLAEVNNGHLPSYLGLRFPASDIPKQARDLYVLNTVRIIPDAGYSPSPLRGVAGQEAHKLDLSLSLLRSVSPVHLEYMRNMGTMSSMSISLVTEGRLWGLISAHHAEPKLVPYLVRSACDMLSKVAGTQLAGFDTAARLHETVRFHAVQRNIVTELAAEANYLDGLARAMPELLTVTNADGVALIVGDRIVRFGDLPDETALRRLGDWLETRGEMELWYSSHLSSELPWALEIKESGSGMLAIRISAVQCGYVLWFRPEIVKTVRWAGEPGKIVEANQSLHPRRSFAEWKEIVRGRSAPWTSVEIESARDFRAALTTIGLRRAEEAIELGEARFQQLTQALPVRVFTADDTGRLTYTNERWQATGMSSSGRWFDEQLLAPEDSALCASLWESSVKQNRTFEVEVRLRPKDASDGPERWNFVRAVPFQRAGAQRAGWIGCFIDLTESKEREMALRMHEKLALTGRMTSVIAHEINNPLEAITNLMYLLRAEIDATGPATGYISMVESELERISGITKQTLRWNRESSDARERFAAGPMVDDVLRLFAGKIRNRQIVVGVDGDREAQMCGVIGQLRQVLANLVSNAIDAAPLGGHVTIRILTEESEGGRVGFAVEDNGRGISAETQKRLFEPFYSTKGDLGNGLGLYISREIVERHGGSIDIEASSELGTRMRVLLPSQGPAVNS